MGCKAVDRFQTDPEVRVAICNIIAGGVGITLTAAVNALRSQVQTTPSNACTKNRLVLVEAVGKGREQHQLAVGRNHIPYTLFHSPVLGLVESHADLGELSKEVLVVGLRSVRCSKPLGERPLRFYGRCIFDGERNPAADFRRQIEDVILLSTKRHLFHRRFNEVRCPACDPAVIVFIGIAVSLSKGEEAPCCRVANAAQEIEQVSWPVNQ